MSGGLYFEIAALILSVVLFGVYTTRRSIFTADGVFYAIAVGLNIVASAASIVASGLLAHYTAYPLAGLYAVQMTFTITSDLSNVMLFAFTLSYLKGFDITVGEVALWRACALFVVAMVLATPFTHWIFYIQDGEVLRGSLYWMFPALYAVMLPFEIYLFVKHRERITVWQRGAVCVCIVMSAAVAAFQAITGFKVEDFVSTVIYVIVYAALTDPSAYFHNRTMCLNRIAFRKSLEYLMHLGLRFRVQGIVFVGLDQAIDRLGLRTGDMLIESLATTLQGRFGRRRVFYLDNMRFAVIVFGNERRRQDALEWGLAHLDNACIADDVDFALEASFCTVDVPGVAKRPEEVVRIVDYTLAEVNAGVDRVLPASAEAQQRASREEAISRAVRTAVANRDFKVYYQPIYRVADGAFATSEALVRLIDADLGFISPEEFVPLAEREGSVVAMGMQIFEQVCEFWNRENLPGLGVSYVEVNLSIVQCMQCGFAADLMQTAARFGRVPSDFNLEITETGEGSNQPAVRENVDTLIKAGYALSLDDFGSGYSTMSYLLKFPANLVKIDKGLLWPAMEDAQAMQVLLHTIALIKSLGKHCLVEGVETQEMADVLIAAGVDYMQGYLYSKPLPEADYVAFLREHGAADAADAADAAAPSAAGAASAAVTGVVGSALAGMPSARAETEVARG